MHPVRTLPLIVALSLLAATPARADETAAEAYATLAALDGQWRGTFANGREHTVSYRSSAGGSVLVETWALAPGRESLTIYHLDGDRLLATHYCPQGNAPRLQQVDDGDPKRISFRFVDGTGLQPADGWHQHEFWIEPGEGGRYTRSETYVPNVAPATAAEAETPDPPVTYTRITEPG